MPAPDKLIIAVPYIIPRAGGPIPRRRFLRWGFAGGFAFAVASTLGSTLQFAWPRNVKGFGGRIVGAPNMIPRPGDPPVFVGQAQAWLVRLAPGEGARGNLGAGGAGGLLALWKKCLHPGCQVEWRPDADLVGEKSWFRCPCHGSTYNRAGIRVYGPAPRPMDTFAIAFDDKGRLVIDTGKVTTGAEDNAERAIPTG